MTTYNGPLRLAELPAGPVRDFAAMLAGRHSPATLRAWQHGPVNAGDCEHWGILPAEWRCAVNAALGERLATA